MQTVLASLCHQNCYTNRDTEKREAGACGEGACGEERGMRRDGQQNSRRAWRGADNGWSSTKNTVFTDYTQANTPLFSGYQRLCIHNAGGCITQGNHPDMRGPEAEKHLVTEVQSRKTSSWVFSLFKPENLAPLSTVASFSCLTFACLWSLMLIFLLLLHREAPAPEIGFTCGAVKAFVHLLNEGEGRTQRPDQRKDTK